MKDYIISFKSLKDGVHDFDFRAKEAFFQTFDNEDIGQADISVKVVLEKKSNMLELDLTFSGTASFECDRCLAPCVIDLSGEHTLYYKFAESESEEEEDVYYVGPSETEIDISQPLYEYVVLSIPARRVHADGECDPDVMAALDRVAESAVDEEPDPRWDALKKLKKNR